MKRLLLSIFVGLLTSAILASLVDHILHTTQVYPPYGEPNFNHSLMLIAFSYRVVFAILGAYITAALAREQAHKAVLMLGGIGSLLWLVGAIAMWHHAPAWYNLIGVITAVPIALIGKAIYKAKQKTLA